MVEVFKTNVMDTEDAQRIINQIHESFSCCQANFALDDCDKILRVKCLDGLVCATEIIEIVAKHGFEATILPDDCDVTSNTNFYSDLGKNTPMDLSKAKFLSLI